LSATIPKLEESNRDLNEKFKNALKEIEKQEKSKKY